MGRIILRHGKYYEEPYRNTGPIENGKVLFQAQLAHDIARSQVGVARTWPRIVRIVSLAILGLALVAMTLWFTLR
jgi:hypothetical protein